MFSWTESKMYHFKIIVSDAVKAQLTSSSIGAWVGIAAGAVVFCLVVVFVISQCTDCYNAEVATDSHAACGASKTYTTPVNTHTSGHPHYGTQAGPGASYSGHGAPSMGAPLPYTLNPEPSSSSQASAPPIGPGGLGSNTWGSPQPPAQQNLPQHGIGAQGQQYTGPEQPPSYTEAMRGTSY